MNISMIIKNKRLDLKESQGEFGKRFGISHAAVSDIERGKVTHIPKSMIELILTGERTEVCPACNGEGYIVIKTDIKAL